MSGQGADGDRDIGRDDVEAAGPAGEAPPLVTIGERIKQARKAMGLNQISLAERVGVSQPAVANWESGIHDPRRVMLAKLADALNVSVDWLAGGARSSAERDKHAAAAYIRRPLQHIPVISFVDAARFLDEPESDPHTVAEDYIPVTSGATQLFALILDDKAVGAVFPPPTLVVVDYADRRPKDGAFCLVATDGAPIVRRWRDGPPRLAAASIDPDFADRATAIPPRVIGCVRLSIRFH